jgi:hypothetical protein
VSILNGTKRYVRPIFAIQINTCRDRTKRVGTVINKFRVRCFQPLSALSMAAKRSIWFDRFRASPYAAPKRWDDRWFGASERESYNDIKRVGRTPSPPRIKYLTCLMLLTFCFANSSVSSGTLPNPVTIVFTQRRIRAGFETMTARASHLRALVVRQSLPSRPNSR